MRLAQLARQLGITQSEITSVLSEYGFEGKSHGNSKLEHEVILTLYKHFNYQEEQEIDDPEMAAKVEKAPEETEATPFTKSEKKSSSVELEPKNEVENNIEPEQSIEESIVETASEKAETAEVIRAKKVKLEGIKVVGKIDLPEPKEIDSTETKEKNEEKPQKQRSKRNRRKNSKRRDKRTLSYEEKIKREEKRKAREKEARKNRLKEKKKKHYFENIQPKSASPKIKQKTKKKRVEESVPRKEKPTYNNPIRKFWAWLNGEYDRY